MQAFGSDRVRADESGAQQILLSRLPKGWTPRAAKTLTSAEFPGTAVLWEGAYFQVVEAEPLPQGGVQYRLEPWPESHAIRVSDRYDEESETARAAEWRAQLAREKRRKSASFLSVFAGHFPEAVQEHLGRELGLFPARMTMVSAFGTWLITAGLVYWIGQGILLQTPRPLWAFIVAFWLGLESTIRFFAAMASGRAMGSPLGVIAYITWYLGYGRHRGALSPFAQEKGRSIKTTEASPAQAELDAFTMRESLVTLLPRADQERIAARYPYLYRRSATIIACILLSFSLLGVVTSFHSGARFQVLMAAALSLEQIWRLTVFPRHPAGSVLGVLVRPFMRRLLI